MYFVSIIPFLILLIYDYKHAIHMAQQNLYNDDHRFLKWTIKDLKQFKTPLKCILIIIVTFILLMLLRVSNVKISNVYLISAYFFLTISLLLNITVKEKKAVQTKIGLKITGSEEHTSELQ